MKITLTTEFKPGDFVQLKQFSGPQRAYLRILQLRVWLDAVNPVRFETEYECRPFDRNGTSWTTVWIRADEIEKVITEPPMDWSRAWSLELSRLAALRKPTKKLEKATKKGKQPEV